MTGAEVRPTRPTAPTRPTTRPTTPAAQSRSTTTVLYIAGSGRSGSTLLERMLGAIPGFFNVGELVDLSRRVLTNDELCGCGEAFSGCPFWTAVGARIEGGFTTEYAERLVRLQLEVARNRHIGRLMVKAARNPEYTRTLVEYRRLYRELFAAISAESGARVVVDASKGASLALGLSSTPGLDVRMLHLVRDARGVAFSWAKSDVARPHGGIEGSVMNSFPPRVTAARWVVLQAQIEAARHYVDDYTFVRYEDLVSDPASALRRATSDLGLPIGPGDLGHIRGQEVDLPASHGLSGNPSRFRLGPQTLRADEKWRTAMSPADQRIATAIALAPLARYGYLTRRGSGAAR